MLSSTVSFMLFRYLFETLLDLIQGTSSICVRCPIRRSMRILDNLLKSLHRLLMLDG
jgi:hypothetical protein